jgi:hypothetical protein
MLNNLQEIQEEMENSSVFLGGSRRKSSSTSNKSFNGQRNPLDAAMEEVNFNQENANLLPIDDDPQDDLWNTALSERSDRVDDNEHEHQVVFS